jgi:glycosyltransferase involved in cell wall biosynthesis
MDRVGGNEQGVGQMAWRLARRGHDVTVYCETPWRDEVRAWQGTTWAPLDMIDTSRPGVWALFRCPEYAARLSGDRSRQRAWLVIQDFEYDWEAPYFDRLDRIIPTCPTHRDILLKRYPHFAGRIGEFDNGVKLELLEELEAEGVERNPFRVMFASSPDRGLRTVIQIFRRARETVRNLELHAFYGFSNIEAIIAREGPWPVMEREKALITKMAQETEGVYLHGRVTQRELYRSWLSSGFWLCPTFFREMQATSSKEAQCAGAIPIATPYWGVGDNVRHGVFIVGDPDTDMGIARFAGELVGFVSNLGHCENIRREMMAEARVRCNWETRVDQWEAMA